MRQRSLNFIPPTEDDAHYACRVSIGTPHVHASAFLTVVALAATAPSLAQSPPPLVLYSNLPGSPTRAAPAPNLQFQAGASLTDAFLSLAVAPGGDRWAIRARVVPTAGGAATEAILTGTLDNTTTAGGARIIARTSQTSYVSSRTWDAFGASLSANDANQIAFAANLGGTTNDDELVTRWSESGGGTWATIAREDTQALGQPAGVRYGPLLQAVHLLPNGLVGVHASLFAGAPTLQALFHLSAPGTGSLIASNTTTTPSSQLASPNQPVAAFLVDQFTTGGNSSSFTSWYVARLSGPINTDMVLVRNNAVIAQEGFVKPGSGFSNPVATLIDVPATSASFPSSVGPGGPGGEALYFGSNADTVDWAAVCSDSADTLIAQTNTPIFPGANELWNDAEATSTTFMGGAINSTNVWVLAGKTNASGSTNTVIVHETAGVILREGDGLDLNGDGLANDNAILADIAPGSIRFGSNGRVYAIVLIRSSTSTLRGWAVIRLLTPIGNVCDPIDFNNDASLFDPTDIDAFLSVFSEGPCVPATATCNDIDFNNDGSLFDPADIDSFLSVFSEGPCL